jgi:hypothetical protein
MSTNFNKEYDVKAQEYCSKVEQNSIKPDPQWKIHSIWIPEIKLKLKPHIFCSFKRRYQSLSLYNFHIMVRKILRKIYGPVKENELWRIRRNDELEDIIKVENIVRFINSQRIQWLGHIERMQDTAIPKKMMYGKLYATRRRGRRVRPKTIWLDDVSTDLRKMGINEW